MKQKLLVCMIFLFAIVCNMQGQRLEIKGIVLGEEDGEPVIGASVVVKGTTIGTVTDYNGNFTLSVDADALLQISYVGMVTREVKAQPSMRILLQSDSQLLDDVIVIAYGTAKKSSFTGAASTIGERDLDLRPLTSATSALEGNIPGLQVAGGSGQPGEAPQIRIRGFGSLNASNNPIYVVDGAIYNGTIADINPNDIASVTVLKDAASTSLYGSSAANGVILITTKSAKDNDTRITFNTTQGFSIRGLPEYNKVNVWEYYPLQWEMLKNQYISANKKTQEEAAEMASANIYSQLKYNPFRGIANDQIVGIDGKLNPGATSLLWGDDLDWNNEMERVGYRGEYNVSYSNRTSKSDAYVSIGYLNDKGYVKKSDFERYSARANFNVNPVKWFKTGLNLSASKTKSTVLNTESNTGYVNYFYFARNIGPIYPIYRHDPETGAYLDNNYNVVGSKKDAQYDYNGERGGSANSGRHIVAETMWNDREYGRNAVTGNTYAEITFLEGFKGRVNAILESSDYRWRTYENNIVGDGAPAGRARVRNIRRTTTTINQLLTYDKSWGAHHIDALLGHESYAFKYQYSDIFKENQTIEGVYDLSNFITPTNATSYTHEYKKESYFMRLNYDYDDKYYISASYRRDGSSRFHKDNRWGNFGSVGVSWRIDQEDFLETVSWINSLKFRASYGLTGNDRVLDSDGNNDYYPYQTLYALNNANAAEPGVWFNSLGNADVKWESIIATDFALEFKVFDRLSGTLEYFMKDSKDLLFDVPLPESSGVVSVWRNIGKLSNQGFEMELNYEVIRNRNWNWNIGINAAFVKNKMKRMSFEGEEIITGRRKISKGHSIYEFWLREYVGVNPENGSAFYRFDDEEATWSDSDCFVIDGMQVTTNQAKAKFHYAANPIPKVYGGVTTQLRYKAFEMSALFGYSLGGKVYASSYQTLMSVDRFGGAMHSDIKNRWQNPGDITDVPRLDSNQSTAFNADSDRWLVSSNYLSLKSLVFAYNLPKSFLNKLNIQNARVSLSGENLFLITKLKGLDPQQAYTGVTNNAHIQARSFTFGLNFTL